MPQAIDQTEVLKDLSQLNKSLELVVDYFQKKLGLQAVLIYKDSPNQSYRNHYHNEDCCLYVLEGGIKFNFTGKQVNLIAGDFKFIPKNYYHSTKIDPEGCTYIIANNTADFEKIYR